MLRQSCRKFLIWQKHLGDGLQKALECDSNKVPILVIMFIGSKAACTLFGYIRVHVKFIHYV